MMTYDRLIVIIHESQIGSRVRNSQIERDTLLSEVEDLARRIWREMEPGQPT